MIIYRKGDHILHQQKLIDRRQKSVKSGEEVGGNCTSVTHWNAERFVPDSELRTSDDLVVVTGVFVVQVLCFFWN